MRALILVDLQNDFLPGGALAVNDGNAVVPVANSLMPRFDLVVATQDWHPANHLSFASQHTGQSIGDVIELDGLSQVLWPDHCIQESPGAELVTTLNSAAIDHVVRKGTDRRVDSYSGFFDNGQRQDTGLHAHLTDRRIRELAIMGLATDYCVKFTVLDACRLGYAVQLVLDGCRGVDLNPGDVATAIDEIRRAGVEIVDSDEINR